MIDECLKYCRDSVCLGGMWSTGVISCEVHVDNLKVVLGSAKAGQGHPLLMTLRPCCTTILVDTGTESTQEEVSLLRCCVKPLLHMHD